MTPPRGFHFNVDRRRALAELAGVFLKLGTTAFGGPAAHMALMEDEVVRRRGWLTREAFLDLVGATNLIPGPNSTELAIHVGAQRAGAAGLVVAGLCFILPAVLIVSGIAWAYVAFGSLPQAAGLLAWVQPVVIAVVLQALWRLGRSAVKTPALAVLALGATAAVFTGVNELVVLFGAGALWLVGTRGWPSAGQRCGLGAVVLGSPVMLPASAVASAGAAFSASTLFLVFLKVGAVLFGSGYVLLAFLRADLVQRLGWLTEAQLLDAIAVGQVTPGPVFTTATFVGYVLGGPVGATLATVGIFLPAFVFVALSAPLLPRLRASRPAAAFLDAVNVASLALMLGVTWHLGVHTLNHARGAALAVAALALLRLKVNSAWLVAGAASAGLLFGQ
ncbi:MAG: chromate efflux transporter [Gemmatimonadetes bacterium]|nr:chromate efflux transporter [Gemmatimonadota bacterium]